MKPSRVLIAVLSIVIVAGAYVMGGLIAHSHASSTPQPRLALAVPRAIVAVPTPIATATAKCSDPQSCFGASTGPNYHSVGIGCCDDLQYRISYNTNNSTYTVNATRWASASAAIANFKGADFAMVSTGMARRLSQQGGLATLQLQNGTAADVPASDVGPTFDSPSGPGGTSSSTFAFSHYRVIAFAVNKAFAAKNKIAAPLNWSNLCHSPFKGKVAVPGPNQGGLDLSDPALWNVLKASIGSENYTCLLTLSKNPSPNNALITVGWSGLAAADAPCPQNPFHLAPDSCLKAKVNVLVIPRPSTVALGYGWVINKHASPQGWTHQPYSLPKIVSTWRSLGQTFFRQGGAFTNLHPKDDYGTYNGQLQWLDQ